MQKKTFTKWVNSHLARVTCRVGDLYSALRDGRNLLRLLEVLSGETLVSWGNRQKGTSETGKGANHRRVLERAEQIYGSCA